MLCAHRRQLTEVTEETAKHRGARNGERTEKRIGFLRSSPVALFLYVHPFSPSPPFAARAEAPACERSSSHSSFLRLPRARPRRSPRRRSPARSEIKRKPCSPASTSSSATSAPD